MTESTIKESKLFSMDKQTGEVKELGTVIDFKYTTAKGNSGDIMVYSQEANDFIPVQPPAEITLATQKEATAPVISGLIENGSMNSFTTVPSEFHKQQFINESYDGDMNIWRTPQEYWAGPHHVKIDPTTTVVDDKTKAEYKKAADRAKALKDMTIKGLEAIEDQLSDIQDVLDNLAEDNRYGSDAYWHKQVVDLTKFYLQDMIAQRHRSEVKLTEQDVIALVSLATDVATKSVKAIKEQVNAA